MDPGSLMIAATAAQTVGSLVGGSSQASAYNQQADAANANARAADVQAQQAYQAGALNEAQQRRQQTQQLGQIRASVAESGFDSGSGTALQVQQDATMNAEMDALQTRYEGLLRGDAYTQQASMDRYTAKNFRASASNARTSSYLSAATTALGGAATYGILKARTKN